ncbi:MAG TPA: hypothetical protein VK151_04555 [Fluviicola sp.]|nr:hypothetical protein [Fluviicola sp.]
MNAAHQHLLINHFPIIALILGILVILIGILAKSSVTRRVGLLLFLIAGITSMVSMSTGEGAEEIVEHAAPAACCEGGKCSPEMMQKIEEQREHFIHEHEEQAEAMMPFMWGIIGLSLIALFLEWKKKSMALIASITVLLVGMIATYFARQVGTSGGEISHPEIRKGYKTEHHEEHH